MKGLRSARGFTMIEILVVIAMIGILATIFVPKITDQLDKPKKSRAMIEIKTMKNALDMYFAENNIYPTTAEAVTEVMNESGVLGGKFGKKSDPWGNPYCLNIKKDSYSIWSGGAIDKTDDNIYTKHDDTEIYVDGKDEAMPELTISSNKAND
ncbi:hypothetical protein JCM14036_33800 [Desulfotomaculum defluvii]